MMSYFTPLTAGAEYIFLVPPFKHVTDKMWHESELKMASLPLFCEICIIFTLLKLWIALARHNFLVGEKSNWIIWRLKG